MTVRTEHPPLELHDVFSFILVRDRAGAERLRARIEKSSVLTFSMPGECTQEHADDLGVVLDAADRAMIPHVDELREFLSFVEGRHFTVYLMKTGVSAAFQFVQRALTREGFPMSKHAGMAYVSTPDWVQQLSAILGAESYYEAAARSLALQRANIRLKSIHTLEINGTILDPVAVASHFDREARMLGTCLHNKLADLRIACHATGVTMIDTGARTYGYTTPLGAFRPPLPRDQALADTFMPAVN